MKNINKKNLFFKSKDMKISNNIWKKELIRRNNSKKSSYLHGIKISLKGRIGGIKRTKELIKNFGSCKPNNLNIFTYYNKTNLFTKWGIWNLKVYLLRNLNQ